MQLLLVAGPRPLFFRTWGVHTNLAGLASAMTGMTLIVLGVVCCVYAWSIGMRFRHSATARWLARRGGTVTRLVGISFFLVGVAMWATIVGSWISSGFGPLQALPYLSFATTLTASGLEMIGAAFLVHIISLRR